MGAPVFQALKPPGIAAQNLMAKGIGFGPEGDYKTAALGAVLFKMAEGREGATGFMEDYTYDLTSGSELELAAHIRNGKLRHGLRLLYKSNIGAYQTETVTHIYH